MTCARVLQVWFGGNLEGETRRQGLAAPRFLQRAGADHWLSGNEPATSIFGVKLWTAPDGGHVYRWSIDMVTCADERWTLFGPFEDTTRAMRDLEMLRRNVEARGSTIEGWRLFNEHCVIEVFRGPIGSSGHGKPDGRPLPWPRQMWTDG